MKYYIIRNSLLSLIIFTITFQNIFAQKVEVDEIKNQLEKKFQLFDGRWPQSTEEGKWIFRDQVNWLSGFIGGELWYMYEITGDESLKEKALQVTDSLIEYADIDYTHDMGFIFLPTCLKAYEYTGERKYLNAVITAAEMLAKRFNENGNFIRAWGKLGSESKAGLMIIDTMMNLELLFKAAELAGRPDLYDIAYKHAITCMQQTVRQNFSSFHVVEFNPQTGDVIKKYTHQGYKDESTWARGQAWGIYGFAIAYKYTNDERFLKTSKQMADYFIKYLPEDYVPYWDLDLKGEGVLRDASAGVIASSGMELLSSLVFGKNEFNKYHSWFKKIAKSIINNYTFLNSERENEEGLLIHTIYNYHKDWAVDESFPCGDYYFVEVLKKYIDEVSKYESIGSEIRSKININENWFYLEDQIENYNQLHLTDQEWQRVDIPHSWNKYDALDDEPGYRRGISWYHKSIPLSKVENGKRYSLYFEGVNLKAYVYINDKLAGEHIGGYVGFKIDITEYLRKGDNEVFVKVDNSIDRDLIPSQKSDFFIYGGIFRDVFLTTTSNEYISQLHISTPKVSAEKAEIKADVQIDCENLKNVKVSLELISNDGKVVFKNESEISKKNSLITFPVLNEPHLWSIDDPYLYTVKATLLKEDKVIDTIEDRIGLRWFRFEKHGPFFLNGERVLLRGTHRHEDYAGMANAIPNDLHRKDIEMIKEMGANFIRLAHYPQDPEVYEACDELGILVWDELPWCRGGVGGEKWKANTTRLFEEMINQNYNHPSIILWSVGNEIYWLPEFDGGGEVTALNSMVTELHNLAHKLDPYRLTSIRKYYDGADLVDVFSPSIWAGWYSGVYSSYAKAVNEAQEKYNHFLHTEYGGSSHLGRHTETPITGEGMLNPDEWSEAVNQVKVKNIAKIGDWTENYIVDLFDWHLMVSETDEDFIGNAQWAFKDFGTPLRPENAVPYLNQKGLVDRAGNPKDAYYVFKSYWNKKDKFCYIESHTWTERIGPEGVARDLTVYSNCEKVELFVNGQSFGVKEKDITKFPANGLVWSVQFSEGKNVIVAKGVEEESTVSDTTEVTYYYSQFDKPERIVLDQERLSNGNYLITARMVDKDNRTCLDYNKRVYFDLNGAGKLLKNYGTYTRSSVIEFASGRAAIEFKPVPFGKTVIEARNQDFKGSWIIFDGNTITSY